MLQANEEVVFQTHLSSDQEVMLTNKQLSKLSMLA